jgi:hypothetical protein
VRNASHARANKALAQVPSLHISWALRLQTTSQHVPQETARIRPFLQSCRSYRSIRADGTLGEMPMQMHDAPSDETASPQTAEPARWRIARTIMGFLLIIKTAGVAKNATGHDGFALGAFVLACAAALLVEGARQLLLVRTQG